MAIAIVDEDDSGALALDQSDVTSLTIPITTSGSDRMLVVVVGAWDATTSDSVVSGVTFNGSAAGWSELITSLGPGASVDRASIWICDDPAAATANVVITFGGTVSEVGACVISLSGAGTPRTAVTNEDSVNATVSLTVGDAVTGDLIIYGGYASGADPDYTAGANQTNVCHSSLNANARVFCDHQAGASGTAMTGTLDSATDNEWVVVGVAIAEAVAAAGAGDPLAHSAPGATTFDPIPR